MRVPVEWLREWVDFPWDAETLAERLTQVGLEVEGIERPGEEVAGIVAARVEHVEPISGTDLRLVVVDAGRHQARVVTAAANVAAGDLVAYAPPGARLAQGRTIEARTIQGVVSEGMLCSAAELGLPAPAGEAERLAAGLLHLDDLGAPAPGDDLVARLGLGEPVIVLELTPNYAAHCQSILGVAREVAAICGGTVKTPQLPAAEPDDRPFADPSTAEPTPAEVVIDAPDLCSRYLAHVLAGVRVGPSPLWMQRRLQQCGMRPINNVVDITNYVMLETGQPLHAFDAELVGDQRIIVRRASPGEQITTLDGQTHTLAADDLVIADPRRAIALAGVMGGANSEVSDRTTTVLLEAAHFKAEAVAKTARRLGIRTDASARFEKGVDPLGVAAAAARAAGLIARYANARQIGAGVDRQAVPFEPLRLPYRPERINRLLGTGLSETEIRACLQHYGFSVDGQTVAVPSYRSDIHGEADLAEEVARLHGYDRIPAALPTGAPATAGRTPLERDLRTTRRYLTATGFTEIMTFSFIDEGHADRLRLPAADPQRRAIRIANPMSEDQAVLRTQLLGQMLDTLAANARRREADQRLFEIGTVYLPVEGRPLPDERLRLILAAMGRTRPAHWSEAAPQVDVLWLKGIVEHLAVRLQRPLRVEQTRAQHALHPGRSGVLTAAGREIGYIGELHPDLLDEYELPERVVVAELDLSGWLQTERLPFTYRPLPRYPAVERDVALVLPEQIPASRVEQVIVDHGGEWLEAVTLFDVYQGDPVPAGCRSLAFTLRYRASDRTLTDEEVDRVHARVREALASTLDAQLR